MELIPNAAICAAVINQASQWKVTLNTGYTTWFDGKTTATVDPQTGDLRIVLLKERNVNYTGNYQVSAGYSFPLAHAELSPDRKTLKLYVNFKKYPPGPDPFPTLMSPEDEAKAYFLPECVATLTR